MNLYYDLEKTTHETLVHSVKGNLVVFHDTIFYPGGGGQPCDQGEVIAHGASGKIVNVTEAGGVVSHEIHGLALREGETVQLRLDTHRRDALVRMHTGEHILFKSLQTIVPTITLDKIFLAEDESKLFVHESALSWEEVLKAEQIANAIIAKDVPITETIHSRQEALDMQGLRIKPERIPGDSVRIISIKDFDLSACRGIHAHHSGFVRSILITSLHQYPGGFELRFKTDALKDAFMLAGIARLSAYLLKTSAAETPKLLTSLLSERDKLKESYRSLIKESLATMPSERIGGLTLRHTVSQGVERKAQMEAAATLCVGNTIIALIDQGETNALTLLASPESGKDAGVLLKTILASVGGKGGGNPRSASGSSPASVDEIISALRAALA